MPGPLITFTSQLCRKPSSIPSTALCWRPFWLISCTWRIACCTEMPDRNPKCSVLGECVVHEREYRGVHSFGGFSEEPHGRKLPDDDWHPLICIFGKEYPLYTDLGILQCVPPLRTMQSVSLHIQMGRLGTSPSVIHLLQLLSSAYLRLSLPSPFIGSPPGVKWSYSGLQTYAHVMHGIHICGKCEWAICLPPRWELSFRLFLFRLYN